MQMEARKSAAGQRRDPVNLRPILDVVKRMNTERSLRRLVTVMLDTMIEFSNAHRGTIAFFKGDRFNAELSRDRAGNEIPHSDIPLLGLLLRFVVEQEDGVVIGDARRETRFKTSLLLPGQVPISVLCLPLRVKTRLIGAVYLDNTEIPNAFGPGEREFAEILTDHAAIAIENALLHRHSTRDRTTNVYNHPHFEQLLEGEIERAQRLAHPCGLLMIDVDDFKEINDLHGHETGNEVLRNVAYTLATTVRGVDIVGRAQGRPQEAVVARYGGDEFEIILPGASREGALKTARRLVTLFHGQKFMSGGKRLKLSISIGVAVYPDDAKDANELILRADEALYQCKRAGKGRAALCKGRDVTPSGRIRIAQSPSPSRPPSP